MNELKQISEIQIIPIKPQNGLVAFASFVLDSKLYLGSIAIITRPKGGYRLVYPTKKVGEKDINIFHPIDKEFAKTIESLISNRLNEVMNNYERHKRN
ncbi:septation protein SpoVG family protein [Candidatus Dojkabacteria bacterium]|nr:septation protein SpoVG family protein [Candidatus Dojkabacteria bacterium]